MPHRRLNPAEPLYEHRKQHRRLVDTTALLEQTVSAGAAPAGTPVDGTTESVYLDGDVLVYTSTAGDASDIITYPLSTLVLNDPLDPDVLVFPTLAAATV